MHTYIYTYIHTHTHTYTHTYIIYIHTHTRTHTHTCIRVVISGPFLKNLLHNHLFMADSWRIHGGFMADGFAKVDNGFG